MNAEKSPFRELDNKTREEIQAVLHQSRFGSLSTLNPDDGYPMSSRILVATDYDGTPVTLISTLAAHTKSLLTDSRCSLMIGEPGKGDPLASPRLMLTCDSQQVMPGSQKAADLRDRFARIHPKSKLYLDFADFSFFRLQGKYATYNGGFGRAFRVSGEDMQVTGDLLINSPETESDFVTYILQNCTNEIQEILNKIQNKTIEKWKIQSIDDLGIDFIANEKPVRLSYFIKIRIKEDIKTQISAKIVNMF